MYEILIQLLQKKIFYMFLLKNYLYSFFRKNIFICLLYNLNEEKFDLFYSLIVYGSNKILLESILRFVLFMKENMEI